MDMIQPWQEVRAHHHQHRQRRVHGHHRDQVHQMMKTLVHQTTAHRSLHHHHNQVTQPEHIGPHGGPFIGQKGGKSGIRTLNALDSITHQTLLSTLPALRARSFPSERPVRYVQNTPYRTPLRGRCVSLAMGVGNLRRSLQASDVICPVNLLTQANARSRELEFHRPCSSSYHCRFLRFFSAVREYDLITFLGRQLVEGFWHE